jgi:hypothetical protein
MISPVSHRLPACAALGRATAFYAGDAMTEMWIVESPQQVDKKIHISSVFVYFILY